MFHTINMRNNILWQAMYGIYDLTKEELQNEIFNCFGELKNILNKNNVNYELLRSCLTPNTDSKKREYIFAFNDSTDSIIPKIIDCLNYKTFHSIFSSEYIFEPKDEKIALSLFFSNIKAIDISKCLDLKNINFIYINNLTKQEISNILKVIAEEESFVGYNDFTLSNDLKDYLAYILSPICITLGKRNIVLDSLKNNLFKDDGKNIFIPDLLYYTFLEYKIQTRCIDSNDELLVSSAVLLREEDIRNAKVIISEEKIKYSKENKLGILKKKQLETIKKEDLEKLIKSHIMGEYIFNIRFNEYDEILFNIALEVTTHKIMVAFSYKKYNNSIRLINFY